MGAHDVLSVESVALVELGHQDCCSMIANWWIKEFEIERNLKALN